MTVIMAFDPGLHTGWARYDSENVLTFQSGTLGPNEHHKQLLDLLHGYEPNGIVYEYFNNDGNKAARFDSIEYIGVIKLYVSLRRGNARKVGIAGQERAARTIVTNTWLEAINAYHVDQSPHARDAMRHLVSYMVFDLQMRRFIPEYTRTAHVVQTQA